MRRVVRLPPRPARRLRRLADRRIRTRDPLAYVLGEAWLQHRRFHVDRRVIVPRSHIAELLLDEPRRVAAGARSEPGARSVHRLGLPGDPRGASLSASARGCVGHFVGGARGRTPERRGVPLRRRVRIVRSDLFDALAGARYDLILCNPPYVPAGEMRRLPHEYRHEPRLALASGRDGLDFVRRLLAEVRSHLTSRGVLVAEIGDGRRALERAFPRLPFTWFAASGGTDSVFAITREELPK